MILDSQNRQVLRFQSQHVQNNAQQSLLPKVNTFQALPLSTHDVLLDSEQVDILGLISLSSLSILVKRLVSTKFLKDDSYSQGAQGKAPA